MKAQRVAFWVSSFPSFCYLMLCPILLTRYVVAAGNSLEDQENNLKIYVLLRAVWHFEEQHKRLPGIHDEEVESDIPLLKKSVLAVINALGISNNSVKDEIIHEM